MNKKRNLTSLILILLSLAGLLIVWFWLLPAIDRVKASLAEKTSLRDQYAAQVTNLNKAKTLLDNAGFSSGIPVTEEILEVALPPRREYEDLLAMIENMALSSGLNGAVSISVGQAGPATEGVTGTIPTPITISTVSDYGAVKTFINKLQEGLRPVVVESVSMQPLNTGGVSTAITATTYTRDDTVEDTVEEAVEDTVEEADGSEVNNVTP